MKHFFSIVAICALILGLSGYAHANPNFGTDCMMCHQARDNEIPTPDGHIDTNGMTCLTCHAGKGWNIPADYAGGPLEDEEPVVEPPTEEPPVVEPPTEEPPVVEPPTEEPPVVEPPTEEPPVVEPPTEEPPVVEPPTEEPPAVEPPTEEPPVIEPPTEEPPVIEPPTEEPPVVEPPTEEPPVVEPPDSNPSGPTRPGCGEVNPDGRPTIPGCGEFDPRDVCPKLNPKAEGTVTALLSNLPEDSIAAKIIVYPCGTTYSPELLQEKGAEEGFAFCRANKTSVSLVNADDRKNPATFSGGRHLVVVKIFNNRLKSTVATTTAVVDGDTTFKLDYNKLRK